MLAHEGESRLVDPRARQKARTYHAFNVSCHALGVRETNIPSGIFFPKHKIIELPSKTPGVSYEETKDLIWHFLCALESDGQM